jgi:hypothetical protein
MDIYLLQKASPLSSAAGKSAGNFSLPTFDAKLSL